MEEFLRKRKGSSGSHRGLPSPLRKPFPQHRPVIPDFPPTWFWGPQGKEGGTAGIRGDRVHPQGSCWVTGGAPRAPIIGAPGDDRRARWTPTGMTAAGDGGARFTITENQKGGAGFSSRGRPPAFSCFSEIHSQTGPQASKIERESASWEREKGQGQGRWCRNAPLW